MISFSSERPLAAWAGKERYNGQVVECLTIIFKTGGCAWNRCRMCGYRHERYPGVSEEELVGLLMGQLRWVMEHYRDRDIQMVKLFTSGSFFDPGEVPLSVQTAIGEAFRGKVVVAETRPEYVNEERISGFIDLIDDGSRDRPLYVAMGLETTNDRIREKSIDKGFSFADFKEAGEVARGEGAGVKGYLLMKPLFLTEGEALMDMQSSIDEAAPHSDILSMNLCTVQSRTDVEYYWRRQAYRPPYLWSVLKVLERAPIHVLCDPVGGGRSRGPHNCGKCDRGIVKGIREYALNGDRELLRALLEIDCSCKEEWEFVLEQEMPYCMPLTH